MQRRSADCHRARDDPLGRLVANKIVRPGVLAVVEPTLAVLHPVLEIEERSAGLYNRDRESRPQLRELLGQQRSADAAPDDADVTLETTHFSFLMNIGDLV